MRIRVRWWLGAVVLWGCADGPVDEALDAHSGGRRDAGGSRGDRGPEADRGGLDRGAVDRGVDRGVEDRGVVDRGVADRGVADRGLPDRGVADRGVGDPDAEALSVDRGLPDAARLPDAGAEPALVEADWTPGDFRAGVPRIPECAPLPGGGVGPPVMVSNNPEAFDGPGLLMGNARPTQTRGGREYRLRGEFGLYFHHLYRGEGAIFVQVVATNPTAAPVALAFHGSAYTQDETGGLGLGQSPDFRVVEDFALGRPRVAQRVEVPSRRPVRVWSGRLGRNREVDGRFWFEAADDLYLYVVATRADDLNEAVNAVLVDAPGDYRISGDPPPPFGREAGIYAHDTWQGRFTVAVGAPGERLAVIVNTATGGGHPQVQAFPALMHLAGSARESVGMYGMTYALEVTLLNRSAGERRVRMAFASLVQAELSRYWDGVGVVDGVPQVLRHTPANRQTPLGEVVLAPGASEILAFEAMVPGLTSIPQALLFESVR